MLIVLGYALCGWLPLHIAVAQGYAAPLFPPAGIALGACMLYGMRIWPGILLGSALVQIAAGQHAILHGNTWLGSLVVPFGAVLQAWAGHALARRLIGLPDAFDSPRPILLLLGLVAPLSSFVCASVALPALIQSGAVGSGDALFSWWNWWLGDCIGVVFATPLMLAWFGHPRELWRSRRWAITLPLVCAFAVLALAFVQVRNWELQRLQEHFDQDAEHMLVQVRDQLRRQSEMLDALERLFAISPDVDRTAFHAFLKPWLASNPGIQNFGWSPRVPGHERTAFEARMRDEGLSDFQILGRDQSGRTFVAAPAAEYFPIIYVEPIEGNRNVIGLDPSVLPRTAAPIALSRELGRPVASAPIRLVQESGNQRGVVVYSIVRDMDGERERGVLSAVFRIDDTLTSALLDAAPPAIDLCLVDIQAQPGNRRLSGQPGCETPDWSGKALDWEGGTAFAGRIWLMRFRARPEYVSQNRSWASWSAFISGLLVLDLLSAFLLITSGRTRRTEQLVAQRTHQLATVRDDLQAQRAALDEAQRVARIGSWEWDPLHDILTHSGELARQLGLPPGAPLNLAGLIAHVAAEDRPHLSNALEEALATGSSTFVDCHLEARDGPGAPCVRFNIETGHDASGQRSLHGTMQDISAEREAEAHIHYLAHYDALTRLPNRSLWLDHARTALAAARRHEEGCAVLFLDLDQFKTINDSLGHPVGDRLLTAVAERLKACIREEDMLARIGGDEFVALLARVRRSEDAAVAATHMLDALAQPLQVGEHELSISVSVGIALYPDNGHDVDTLLRQADTAMYGAKAAGRNTFQFFTPGMNARMQQRLVMETALRRALERDELVLYYQPQVSAADGHLTGCEALVRWRHPQLGLVPPGQFIPVAEDCGLIVPLGEWVLREACRQQLRWRHAGHPPIDMAVNISALQFGRPDFAEVVARILQETGADPARIELEITETALMRPTDELLEHLGKLRAQGLKLALDDFGTGYSSLAYLKRLPIARLKLDRSFVKDLPGDAEDAAIASATLSMACNLGLEVIAEGVETEAQRDFLHARQCQTLQGFLYGRPEPAAEFEHRFTSLTTTSA